MLTLDVLIDDRRWKALWAKDAVFYRKLVLSTLKKSKLPAGKKIISLVLTNDVAMQELNKKFRKKNKPTNVLSFPLNEAMPSSSGAVGHMNMLGDVVLSLETIKAEAKAEKKTIRDHVAHLLVHGVLHLLGHDHMNDKDALVMETMEIAILKTAKIANPY